MDNRAIGYLDSGIGGLSVVKQALKQLPNEQVYYIGDTARMPYGPRTPEEVKKFTWQLVDFLMEQDIKLLVIACNTATAAALDDLTKQLPIPVVGVIQPGIDAASKATSINNIGIAATQGTVNSLAYYNGLKKINRNFHILQLAAPTLVKIAEQPPKDDATVQRLVTNILSPIKNSDVDTLVLGCTHFPLLAKFIQEAVGEQVKLVDAGASAVNVVEQTLDNFAIKHENDNRQIRNTDKYFTTGDPETFDQLAKNWLQISSLSVQHVDILDGKLITVE
ncbi:Glutamate racemase [Weissella jogaejeotgali]|uniref:Glutamate racemase n=1 Tax=Weissella jogaejeotgali TaxID=1631871 RepID=A0A1L6RC29_9LACO|nr:glutamate racemase [Weissella jogaejeotgali]APS42083.1 Glutamate racemase [Weissella jogaejeotgali]